MYMVTPDFRALGMDESLFCRLDGLGATHELCLQYRMNRWDTLC